jgi:hypothetical protein
MFVSPGEDCLVIACVVPEVSGWPSSCSPRLPPLKIFALRLRCDASHSQLITEWWYQERTGVASAKEWLGAVLATCGGKAVSQDDCAATVLPSRYFPMRPVEALTEEFYASSTASR